MRTLKDRLLHNQIFRSWLKSYLLLLLIPLTLIVGSYVVFSNAMEDMISQHWDETLQTVRSELDAEFADLEQLTTYCSLDEFVQAYARMDSLEAIQQAPDRIQRIRGLNKSMSYYTVGMDFASAHYLYFHNSGMMYTGGTFFTNEDVHRLGQNAAVSFALRHMGTASSGYIGCFKPDASVPFGVFRFAVLPSTDFARACTVLTELNMEAIQSKMTQYAAMFSGWMGLMDEAGRFLFSGGNVDCRVLPEETGLLRDGTAPARLDGRTVFTLPFARSGLTYVFAMSNVTLNAQLRSFYILMGAGMVLMVLLSALTISRQIKRNYQPIHTLATTIISASGSVPKASMFDYPYLTASLQETAQQRQIMKQTLTEQLLRNLIRHRSEEIEITEHDMTLLEESLPGEYYLVLCLPLHDRDWASVCHMEEGRLSADALRQALLEPLASELEDGCALTGLPIEDYYALLFSCDPAMARIKAESSFHRFIHQQEKQDKPLILAASRLHDSPLDLHQAYREATAAMRMNFSREQTPVVFFDDLPPQQSTLHQSGTDERQQLANLITAGRGEEALALLRELRQQVRGDGGMELLCWLDNIHTISHVLMNASIQARMEEETYQDYIRQLDLLASSTSRSFRRRDEAMDSFVEGLCREIGAAHADAGSDRSALAQSINEIIQQRLSDENLSISMIAEEIGLNPKYMAMQYKEITGVGLLYSIHQQRIDAFKRILEMQPNVSIVQASAEVGYSSQNTLIRWFRKIEGVTPGEYRRTHK